MRRDGLLVILNRHGFQWSHRYNTSVVDQDINWAKTCPRGCHCRIDLTLVADVADEGLDGIAATAKVRSSRFEFRLIARANTQPRAASTEFPRHDKPQASGTSGNKYRFVGQIILSREC